MTMKQFIKRTSRRALLVFVLLIPTTAFAVLLQGQGTLLGTDNDNNLNTTIQPVGEDSKQHMENMDFLIGDDTPNLLIGMLGPDTLIGNGGADITLGGAENFRAGTDPETGEERGANSDVIFVR